jgi:hypothetical protein
MSHLPLYRSRTEPHRIIREVHQSVRGLQESTIVYEVTYVLNSQIMSYILNLMIRVGMILLDNLLQYFLLIAVIDLSSIFDSAAVSI